MSELGDRLARQTRNEALLREVNERISELGDSAQAWSPDGRVEFMCECGAEGGCGERVGMTVDEYDRVRAQDDRFALLPGHETPALEKVVERTERYVIVDKIPAAEPLVADDLRGASSQ